jgi:outer membrane lipoprotein-sorting protein
MKLLLCKIIISALLLSPSLCFSQYKSENHKEESDQLASWIKKLEECMRHNRSFKASFIHEIFDKNGGKIKKTSGTLLVARKNRLRMTYSNPSENILISDGITVRSYNAKTETVVETSTKKEPFVSILQKILNGNLKSLETNFITRILYEQNLKKTVIELVPRTPSLWVSRLIITLNDKCPSVSRLIIIDKNETLIRLTLKNIELNVATKPELFNLKKIKFFKIIRP